LILLLNSLLLNVLTKYNIIIFTVVVLILFKILFGTEKDRNRYKKDIILEIFIILIIFFIIYYCFGIFIGFAKNYNYYTYYAIKTFVIPIIITTILSEYLRYNMLKKAEGSIFLIITTYILFVMFDLTNIISLDLFETKYKTFMFISMNFLPVISRNITSTYISNKFGYLPNIFWLLILNLYTLLLPILPNVNNYIYSIISIMLPLFIGYRAYKFMQKDNLREEKKQIKKIDYIGLCIVNILIIIIVYFTCGYFKYYAIAVGSNSMSPEIKVGDIAVIEKVEKNYENLQVGQILAYKKSDVIIIHRITKILKDDNKYYYYTKGDANENIDNYVIKEEEIIGIVNKKIPYIGLPVIWLRGI